MLNLNFFLSIKKKSHSTLKKFTNKKEEKENETLLILRILRLL